MSSFIRGTGGALTPEKHSLEIFRQYITTTFFHTMMGKRGSSKPIILDDSLFKGRDCGDVGRYHFIPQFYGKGILGQNASTTGNENTLQEFYMDIRIDQIRQAFAKEGKMTDIRTIWNFRDEAKSQLTEWFRNQTEDEIVLALSGYNTDGATWIDPTSAEGLALDAVKGSGRCARPDWNGTKFTLEEVSEGDSDTTSLLGAMTSNDTMNTTILDELQNFAKTANSKYCMKPIRCKDGEEYYILVLHPKAAISLRRDEEWKARARASMTGKGSLENDPIATGAIGVWEHIIIKEAGHILTHSNSSVTIARNLLLGADAAVLAWGQTLEWEEQRRDYNRIYGVQADEIRGMRKLFFDGVDMNVAQVPCAI